MINCVDSVSQANVHDDCDEVDEDHQDLVLVFLLLLLLRLLLLIAIMMNGDFEHI